MPVTAAAPKPALGPDLRSLPLSDRRRRLQGMLPEGVSDHIGGAVG
jgi:hypothetical protein